MLSNGIVISYCVVISNKLQTKRITEGKENRYIVDKKIIYYYLLNYSHS